MDTININWWKVGFTVLVLAGIAIGSFFLGRSTVKTENGKQIIEYIQGETIHDTISYPVPIKVVEPIDTADIISQCVRDGIYSELFPAKVEYIEVTKTDTTKIMQDWATDRRYKETLFDSDTLGMCSVEVRVQYNRMKLMNYNFIPIRKTVTVPIHQEYTFTPFVGFGVSSFPSASIEAGFFIKESWGFSVDGTYYLNPLKSDDLPKWSVGVKILKAF